VSGYDLDTVLTPHGNSYTVTSREQTVLDCLGNLAMAAGPENLLRSVGGFTYLDIDKLLRLASRATASVRARLGWLLATNNQAWLVNNAQLQKLRQSLGAGPYYFFSASSTNRAAWQPRWRLYLPTQEEEMESWLKH